MDKARAHQLFSSLVGHEIGGWTVKDFLGHGKSAIVVGASRGEKPGALKLFDPELVEHFGKEKQLARIEREKTLIGKEIPNLIPILDGGCSDNYLFVAMELLPPPWQPLSERLTEVPRERLWPLINAIAVAAEHLESIGIAHRDIKPENVMVTEDFSQLRLMDLGVMRPIGASSVTDETSRPFIGTLRYSSPEFLFREEKDTTDGWRAVTFYQLGGVLHDLIMRRPLFADFSEPYARLTKAVLEQIPTIDAPDVHADLLLLARNCLIKDPVTRLQCVQWKQFRPPEGNAESSPEAARERVKKRRLLGGQPRPVSLSQWERNRLAEQVKAIVMDSLKNAIRETMTVDELPLFVLEDPDTRAPERARLCLRFGPDEALSISKQVQIPFDITVLDPVERVCRIDCYEPRFGDVSKASNVTPVTLLVGVLEHESIRVRIRDHLYLLMDQIQESGTQEGAK